MNKKENLIKSLRGSAEALKDISEMCEGLDIFDENGIVDTDFLMNCLIAVDTFMAASNTVVQTVTNLLAPDAPEDVKKEEKSDDGQKWSADEVLRHCELRDNVMYLPAVQLNKKSYLEVKKRIEDAGGRWCGGKVQGFTFEFDATRVFSLLKDGQKCNLQQEFQFFATPAGLADWLVELAGGISAEDTVLEPSAGRGAIIDAVHRSCADVVVDCYELMPENLEFLRKKENVAILGENFMEHSDKKYTKIIANPPFSKNQDIKHVKFMYTILAAGGVVAAITSRHWLFSQEKECAEFRAWLDEVSAEKYEIEAGRFAESGTGVETMALVIRKKRAAGMLFDDW